MSETSLERLVWKASKDAFVLAVFLFGSAARGESRPDSDLDVSLVLDRGTTPDEASAKRLEYLAEFPDLDIGAFGQLPIYIRHRILKEGRLLFVRDEEALYDLAFRTAQQFEDFRHRYREYLEEVASG